jgi:CRP/FNR family transcriptional regulator, cyclic AMP receptor protein
MASKKKTAPRKPPTKPTGARQVEQAVPVPRFDSRTFLTSVGAGRTSTTIQPKEMVYRQGDPADAVYYIEAGKIQLTVLSEQGKEGVIAMLEPGEFFGEGCIAGQPFRMASASATAKSTVARIEKAAMIRVLHEQPSMSEMFTTFLLLRNIQIEADLVDQLFNSSERRLARLLLLLANFGKEGKMETIIPTISQDALAARVGTTRPRINYFMNKFRKLGFIEYNGGLKIHTSLLNVIVHD